MNFFSAGNFKCDLLQEVQLVNKIKLTCEYKCVCPWCVQGRSEGGGGRCVCVFSFPSFVEHFILSVQRFHMRDVMKHHLD